MKKIIILAGVLISSFFVLQACENNQAVQQESVQKKRTLVKDILEENGISVDEEVLHQIEDSELLKADLIELKESAKHWAALKRQNELQDSIMKQKYPRWEEFKRSCKSANTEDQRRRIIEEHKVLFEIVKME